MIFAVFDPSPLAVCINCSFFPFIFAVLLPVFSGLFDIEAMLVWLTLSFYDFPHALANGI